MTVSPASPPDVPLPDSLDVDVIVLPREVSTDGNGLYDDSVITLAKELRAEGATAEYQHRPEARQWIGEKSATVIVLAFVIGVASAAGWDGLKRLFSMQYPKDRVKGKLARCTHTADGVVWEWFEVDGTGDEVARAMGAFAPAREESGVDP